MPNRIFLSVFYIMNIHIYYLFLHLYTCMYMGFVPEINLFVFVITTTRLSGRWHHCINSSERRAWRVITLPLLCPVDGITASTLQDAESEMNVFDPHKKFIQSINETI